MKKLLLISKYYYRKGGTPNSFSPCFIADSTESAEKWKSENKLYSAYWFYTVDIVDSSL